DELPFDEGSVDVVTTRSVVIYLDDKPAVLREFFRMLRPGGRLSMFEPINSFGWPEPEGMFAGQGVSAVWDIAAKIRGCYGASTLVGWDERDLLGWVENAGFTDVELTVELRVKPHPMMRMSWDAFLHFAPNPLAPTLQEAMDERLTPEEQERLVAHLRPRIESGEGSSRLASAYVSARKT